MASLTMPAYADEGTHRFTVALPAQWHDATKVRLVLEGVTVPGNRPLKLRVTTVTDERHILVLGSAGIVAVRPTMSEPRRLPPLLIDVTKSLKALPERREGAQNLTIEILAVDGRNDPLTDLDWSAENVRLEATHR
jgi:hypothetical protein